MNCKKMLWEKKATRIGAEVSALRRRKVPQTRAQRRRLPSFLKKYFVVCVSFFPSTYYQYQAFSVFCSSFSHVQVCSDKNSVCFGKILVVDLASQASWWWVNNLTGKRLYFFTLAAWSFPAQTQSALKVSARNSKKGPNKITKDFFFIGAQGRNTYCQENNKRARGIHRKFMNFSSGVTFQTFGMALE